MTRTIEIRFQLLRDGAYYSPLYALDVMEQAPVLRMDDSSAIKTSLSGDFVPPQDVNWLTDEIQPILVIDGVKHPLGVFLPATVLDAEDEATRSVHVDAYDRCWLVQDTCAETRLYYRAGMNYLDPVKQLLTASGITHQIVTPTTARLQEDREDWEIGTSYLEIVNQLLAEINYNPVWFNELGAAVIEPASVPDAENIDHRLDSDNVRSLLLPRISREVDVYSAPNVFLCICSNADKDGPLVAKAENTNPQSPLSIMRRGRRIVAVEHVDNIASQDELQAYANRLRNESMITAETFRVETGLLPGYGVADVTALHYGEFAAVCIERAWDMELRPGGSMNHTLERVVAALG